MAATDALPKDLRDPKALVKRREKAVARKEQWRETYRDCYEYTMPQRETFSWTAPGSKRGSELFDSTGQECVYTAANNMQSLLCPSWKNWCMMTAGADVLPEEAESSDTLDLLQETTETAFGYLNHSNFGIVVPEVFLDLQVGTGGISLDEGEDDQPLVFDSMPLSLLEIEEGPFGTIETTFMKRSPPGRNLERMYRGLKMADLPESMRNKIKRKPDEPIDIVQAVVYHPKTKNYYGIVFDCEGQNIIWSYNYETSSPHIIARASVTSGEIYGRGPVMWALPDIKTLNAMQEFVLTHSAMQVAPPITAVSDGVINPYTASLQPNTVIPVASNDNGNPSMRVLDFGGNFQVTDKIMEDLRARVRRIMLGEMPQSGPVKSATEWMIQDRNRLWAMGAVYGRVQTELLSKVMSRVVYILQKRGKIPPIRIDGKLVTLKYVSPLARAQDDEDLLALQKTLEIGGALGPEALAASLKVERIGAFVARKTGLDADLARSEDETKKIVAQAQQAMQAQAEAAA